MAKEYEVSIKTQYSPASSVWVWVSASSKSEALKLARRKAKVECWFDRRNDGYVSFKCVD